VEQKVQRQYSMIVFIPPIKQQEENRGINSTTKCTRMCKITKKTFKPWELSNLLIPQF
jgi:hypothetical protein